MHELKKEEPLIIKPATATTNKQRQSQQACTIPVTISVSRAATVVMEDGFAVSHLEVPTASIAYG
jgi:hypothetical protein